MYFQTRTKIDINRCIFIVKEVFYTPNKVSGVNTNILVCHHLVTGQRC